MELIAFRVELIPLGQQFIAFEVQLVPLAGKWSALRVDPSSIARVVRGELGTRAPSAATALVARTAHWCDDRRQGLSLPSEPARAAGGKTATALGAWVDGRFDVRMSAIAAFRTSGIPQESLESGQPPRR